MPGQTKQEVVEHEAVENIASVKEENAQLRAQLQFEQEKFAKLVKIYNFIIDSYLNNK